MCQIRLVENKEGEWCFYIRKCLLFEEFTGSLMFVMFLVALIINNSITQCRRILLNELRIDNCWRLKMSNSMSLWHWAIWEKICVDIIFGGLLWCRFANYKDCRLNKCVYIIWIGHIHLFHIEINRPFALSFHIKDKHWNRTTPTLLVPFYHK